ncbi:MAG: pre-peptidase C-terminal domain-containing protein [Saprospiraceae bacterium]|nr:pre-peptidase C-terminal domain-containing protein [Saprospiraceae bacterium]
MKIAMKNSPTLKIPKALSFMITRIWLFTLLVLAMFSSAFAQDPTLVWQANYGSNTNDYAQNIIQTSDGGYLVVGQVSGNTGDVSGSGYLGGTDGWVTKLNASGGMVWKKAFGTSNSEDGVEQAIEVSDGYVLVGSVYSSASVSQRMWFAKISKTTGNITWSNTYNTGSSYGYSIIGTPDGGFLIGGQTLYPTKALLLKTNSSGAITSTYTSNPTGGYWGDRVVQIEKTSDNGYVLLGSYWDENDLGCYPGSEVPAKDDVWLCKITSSYAFSWSKLYGGDTWDYPKDLVAAPDGNLFVLGRTPCTEDAASITGPNNVGVGDWLMKTNSTGTIQDVIIVSVDLLDYTHTRNGIGLTCDNEIVITGITGSLLGVSLSVEKMNTNFDYTYWTYFTPYSTSIEREGYDIISTADNGYAVVGRYESSSKLNDFLILKLSADPGCGSNDFCSKAIPVSCGQFLQNQNNVGESNAVNAYPCVANGTFTGGDKVYKIVLTQTSELQVGLEILQSNKDLDLFLLGSDCNTITCLDKSIKPNVANGSNPYTNKEGIQKVLNAGTYYIVVDGYDTDQEASFNIDFACNQLLCSSATQLTCGIPYSSSTTSGANNVSIYNLNTGLVDDVPISTGDPGKKFDVNNAGPERVHQFTINQQSTVTITLSNVLSTVDLELFLLNNCSTKFCIAKSVNSAGQNEVITMQLNAGTYYVVVDGFRNNAGSYTLNIDCGGCPPPVNNFACNIIKCYYSGNGSNLQYTFTGTQNVAPGYTWKITGNNLNINGSSSNSFSYNFLNPGTYQICYPYIKPDGCVEYCCINFCVSNPFDCDGSITPAYSPTSNGWRFTLLGSGFSNIEWRNDATGQSAGTSYQSNLILPPSPCTGLAQSVSVTYFDGTCYKVCCFRYYPCNPFDCGLITYEYDALQSGYRFELNTIGGFDQSTISWTVDSPVSQSLGTGNELSNLLPLPINCGEYWISVRFKDATGTWKVCCIRIYICNPFDCYDFGYNYVSANNGYNFQLNLSGATNISWTDDNTGNSLGTSATSSVLPIPPGGCAERTITVRYFWNNRWYICCRRVWLCNPFDCFDFAYNYVSANNGYQFQLNLSGATNISWTDDNTGNSLGNSATSNVLPIPPGGCAERTITVRYFWNNRWYICCRTVWICNPNLCGSDINYVWQSGGMLNLSVNQSNQNVSWQLENGQALGSGNNINIPNPGNNSVVCSYFRDSDGVWKLCCVNIGTPPNPTTDLTFDIENDVCGSNNTVIDVPVRVYNFDNVLGFTMTVKSTNGVTAKIESITPVGLNGVGIGSYEVLNTTTGTIVWFNTSPVTLPDASIIFTLKVRVSGNTGTSTALEITGDPASIAAEQIINGVETAVVPISINGSVCLSSTVNISGRITREDNVGVGNVTVQLSGGAVQSATTDTQGNYSFNGLVSGSNYTITPVKDINDKNGLATSDLVVIQRQLAGIAPISTPYKRIAADPTNNKLIGLSDLSSIQRLIGGIELTFPLNTSWRFVDKNWVFTNPSNPWQVNFPEILSFSNVTSNITNADFIGIKVGDPQISNNPQNAGSNELDERQEDILLEADGKPVEIYGKIYIPVKAVHDCELEGIQFTLVCDKPSLVFKSITSDILNGFSMDNYGRPIGYDEALTVVWATPTGLPVQIKEGTVVFWLELEQIGSAELRAQHIRMVSEPTQALATIGNGIDQKIGMRFNTSVQKALRHYITPNPMADHGALILEVPNDEHLNVIVTNSNGQQVLFKKNFYEAGTHVIPLDNIDNYGSQVLFYQIIGETSFGSGKIIMLKN